MCTCPISYTRLDLVLGLTIYLFSGFWVSYNGQFWGKLVEVSSAVASFSLSLSLSLWKLSLVCSATLSYARLLSLCLTSQMSQVSNHFSLFSSHIYSLKVVDWVMITFWCHSCDWGPIWLFLTKICFCWE